MGFVRVCVFWVCGWLGLFGFWFICLKLCVCFSCLGLFGLCMLFMIGLGVLVLVGGWLCLFGMLFVVL